MNENSLKTWREKVKTLPDKPGVYLFKDVTKRVIYVGKAASLIKRVVSYTRPVSDDKTMALVASIHDLDYIVTDSELEALVLENVLIKKEQPRYNVILRDDKNYPYLNLNINEPFPKLKIVRRIPRKKEGLYFGPYVPAGALHSTLKLLTKMFPLRLCGKLDFKRIRPCLNYQMKRCLAPCNGLISERDYLEMVQQIRLFLEGKSQLLQEIIKDKMREASVKLEFEKAANLRDTLSALEKVSERQKIISPDRLDEDIVGMASDALATCFSVLFVRQGIVVGHKNLIIESERAEAPSEMLSAFLQQFYGPGGPLLPPRVLLPASPAHQDLLEDWMSEVRGDRVKIFIPERGVKRQLVNMSAENARIALEQRQPQAQRSLALLSALKEELNLPIIPRRVDGFDISNIHGHEAVGSMVVWKDLGFLKSAYRQFKIKTVEGIDDFAMIAEIVKRRYKNMTDEDKADLILIDGGKGQVSSASAALNELGLNIPLIGLAKREEEIFFPGNSIPLRLPVNSTARRLLQRIRDEAHRFALQYHRKRRSKAAFGSPLEEIPGIGAKRRKMLLAHFGNFDQIKRASLQELENLPFLPAGIALKLYDFFKKNNNP